MNRRHILVSLVFGALAFWLALAITEPLGPGLDPDSMSYLESAQSLANGRGLRDVERDWTSVDSTKVLTHWPPGYPVSMTPLIAAGMMPVSAGRLIQAVSALVWAFLLVGVVSGAAGTWAGVVAGVVALSTPAIVELQENILSEPLFVALLVATLWTMVTRPVRPLVVGVLAAAASMVRYVGLSTVCAAALWCAMTALVDPAESAAISARSRWRAALGVFGVALLPTVVLQGWWTARSFGAPGADRIRDVGVYGQFGDTVHEGIQTLVTWLAPVLGRPWRRPAAAIAAVVLALLIVRALSLARARGVRFAGGEHSFVEHSHFRLPAAALLLAASNVAFLLAARLFADPGIPLDDRLLAPPILLAELSVVTLGAWVLHRAPRVVRTAATVLGTVWLVGSMVASVRSVTYALQSGNDYAEWCWRGSPTLAWLRAHGAGHALFTNVPEAVYFQAGRLARDLPDSAVPDTIQAFTDTMLARHGLLVAFDTRCADVPTATDVVKAMHVAPVAAFIGDTIWTIDRLSSPTNGRGRH